MPSDPITLAGRVIARADRTHPADRVLREVLKAERVAPWDAKEVSQLVFAYYRWRGWLPHSEETPPGHVLRKALSLAERFASQPQSFSDEDLLTHAIPAWLRDEMEVSPALVRSLQSEPKVWLRVRKKVPFAGVRAFGPGLPEAFLYEGEEDLFSRSEFHAGAFEVQDLSSQMVSRACAPAPGESWWDACAGEGGKTVHLSDLMQNKGLIWASDRAEWRLKSLKRRTARAGVFNYRSANWDGGPKLPTKTLFDGVLVDAPCSGVGTWQRNPHARWTTVPQDVAELAEVQARLLQNAAKAVKPGGKLVYSVCTLTRRETEGVLKALSLGPGWGDLEFTQIHQGGTGPGTNTLTIMPQDFASNGMFIAGWKKAKQPAGGAQATGT